MGFFSWFRKVRASSPSTLNASHDHRHGSQKQPEDYEQVLAALALNLQKRQTRLSEIRLRERRSTLLFSLYALGLWVVYVSLWYMNMVPTLTHHPRSSAIERALEGAPVFIGPILCVVCVSMMAALRLTSFIRILFTRRIVQIWYTRIGDAEGARPSASASRLIAHVSQRSSSSCCGNSKERRLRKSRKRRITTRREPLSSATMTALVPRHPYADAFLRMSFKAPLLQHRKGHLSRNRQNWSHRRRLAQYPRICSNSCRVSALFSIGLGSWQ